MDDGGEGGGGGGRDEEEWEWRGRVVEVWEDGDTFTAVIERRLGAAGSGWERRRLGRRADG
jgi:hypothetical protein